MKIIWKRWFNPLGFLLVCWAVFAGTAPTALAQAPDEYEVDDTASQARVIVLNWTGGDDYDHRNHNFHDAGDQDWVQFYAVADEVYEIEVSNVGARCDAVLELYDTDGTTLLKEWNWGFEGEDELTDWRCPRDGIYFVKVKQFDPQVFGEQTRYDLEIFVPVGVFPGYVEGSVMDEGTGQPIVGAVIRIGENGTALSLPTGSYLLVYLAGTFTVTASAPGYQDMSTSSVVVPEAGFVQVDFALTSLTAPETPTVDTDSALSVTSDSATLTGTVNPNGDETVYYFEYGTTTDYGATTPSTSAGSGTSDVQVSAGITMLTACTIYHYRVVATNSDGTSYGLDRSFTTPASGGDVQPETGDLVTCELWIRSVINTEEKGPIEAVWQLGGDADTSRGDRVIWGYFYANPSDVTWGSRNNPDLYVKIWFDVGGRLDVNFFHVSVPDIEVYSDYVYDGSADEQSTTTLSTRYIRQFYQDSQSSSEGQDEDGNPPEGFSPSGNPTGYSTINDLRIGAMINTEETGAIEAIWELGGQDSTDRGDQVVWGYFYASPDDVSWGSIDNPDLYVKIWFDAGGRIDVNFFHVSVPDIEVYSDYPNDGSYDQMGTTIMDNRYIRHEYSR